MNDSSDNVAYYQDSSDEEETTVPTIFEQVYCGQEEGQLRVTDEGLFFTPTYSASSRPNRSNPNANPHTIPFRDITYKDYRQEEVTSNYGGSSLSNTSYDVYVGIWPSKEVRFHFRSMDEWNRLQTDLQSRGQGALVTPQTDRDDNNIASHFANRDESDDAGYFQDANVGEVGAKETPTPEVQTASAPTPARGAYQATKEEEEQQQEATDEVQDGETQDEHRNESANEETNQDTNDDADQQKNSSHDNENQDNFWGLDDETIEESMHFQPQQQEDNDNRDEGWNADNDNRHLPAETTFYPVTCKSEVGTLKLTNDQLQFIPDRHSAPVQTVRWTTFAGRPYFSPYNYPQATMRIFIHTTQGDRQIGFDVTDHSVLQQLEHDVRDRVRPHKDAPREKLYVAPKPPEPPTKKPERKPRKKLFGRKKRKPRPTAAAVGSPENAEPSLSWTEGSSEWIDEDEEKGEDFDDVGTGVPLVRIIPAGNKTTYHKDDPFRRLILLFWSFCCVITLTGLVLSIIFGYYFGPRKPSEEEWKAMITKTPGNLMTDYLGTEAPTQVPVIPEEEEQVTRSSWNSEKVTLSRPEQDDTSDGLFAAPQKETTDAPQQNSSDQLFSAPQKEGTNDSEQYNNSQLMSAPQKEVATASEQNSNDQIVAAPNKKEITNDEHTIVAMNEIEEQPKSMPPMLPNDQGSGTGFATESNTQAPGRISDALPENLATLSESPQLSNEQGPNEGFVGRPQSAPNKNMTMDEFSQGPGRVPGDLPGEASGTVSLNGREPAVLDESAVGGPQSAPNKNMTMDEFSLGTGRLPEDHATGSVSLNEREPPGELPPQLPGAVVAGTGEKPSSAPTMTSTIDEGKAEANFTEPSGQGIPNMVPPKYPDEMVAGEPDRGSDFSSANENAASLDEEPQQAPTPSGQGVGNMLPPKYPEEIAVGNPDRGSEFPDVVAASQEAQLIPQNHVFALLQSTSFDGGVKLRTPGTPQHAAYLMLQRAGLVESEVPTTRLAPPWSEDTVNDNSIIQKFALATLYFATQGKEWLQGESSWADIASSDCVKIHLTCDDDAKQEVVWIQLSSNNLQGSLPDELGLLSSLERLELADNDLTGTIPSTLGLLSGLETLDLSKNYQLKGTMPLEIQALPNLTTLRADLPCVMSQKLALRGGRC